MAITSMIHTDAQGIDRVLRAGVPVLLVFGGHGASLPGAAHAELDAVAARYAGRLLVADVDARGDAALPLRFNVRSTPELVAVRGGAPLATLPLTPAAVRDWAAHLVEGAPRPAVESTPQPAPAPSAQPGPQPHAGGNVVDLNDGSFAQAIAGPGPVLVDFWAPWCGPCRMVGPSVERLAQEYAGRATVAKMNVDQNPRTPGHFGIQGIPTLLIFKHGQVVDRIVGAQPYEALQQRLARQVG